MFLFMKHAQEVKIVEPHLSDLFIWVMKDG